MFDRTSVLRTFVALGLGAALLAGCGGDDDGDSASGDAPANGAQSATGGGSGGGSEGSEWPPEDVWGTGEAGTVTVDGVDYDIDAVRTCDLSDFDAGEGRTRDLMVQGVGVVDPDDEFSELVEVTVFQGTTSSPEGAREGIAWDGPEGRFEGSAVERNGTWTETSQLLDGPPLDLGDRITGEIKARSTLGSPPVELVVDVEAPDGDEVDCD